MCVKRTYVFESIAPKFVSKLKERAMAIKVGDGMNSETTMGPVHSKSQRSKVELQVNETISGGATLLLGGNEPDEPELDAGSFYMPTLVTNVGEDAKLVSEECFGPALPIMTVSNLDQAIESANSSVYGLGASIWTKNLASAKKAASELEAWYRAREFPLWRRWLGDRSSDGWLQAERHGKRIWDRGPRIIHRDENRNFRLISCDYKMHSEKVRILPQARGEKVESRQGSLLKPDPHWIASSKRK